MPGSGPGPYSIGVTLRPAALVRCCLWCVPPWLVEEGHLMR